MNTNAISGINPAEIMSELNTSLPGQGVEKGAPSFASYLEKSVGEVGDLLNTADAKSVQMAMGKSENLHDTMITFEKAETALKLLVQVRNKALEAYHEVMRMQV